MFGISVELLSGRYVASAYNDRDRVEWPPHPARLFSALIATWAEDRSSNSGGEPELAALRWLERQAAPVILASAIGSAGARDVATVFVPVNDVAFVSPPSREKLDQAEAALETASDERARARAEKTVKKLRHKLRTDTAKAIGVPAKFGKAEAGLAENLVSDRRSRQPRTFPSATPEWPTVGFVWTDAEPPDAVRASLAALLGRLVRLGHSSSLVRGSALAPHEAAALASRTSRYEPDEGDGDLSIRWVGPGQAEQLIQAFELHRETEPRVLPARFVRYREGERYRALPSLRGVLSDDVIVFARTRGPRLPIISVAGLSRQFRRALMSVADEPIHEVLSGHQAAGAASEAAHLAVVPLPVVAGQHADGAILGLGLVLPRELDENARRAVMRAIGRLEEQGREVGGANAPAVTLLLGQAGELELQRVAWGEDRRAALQPGSWCRAARRWARPRPSRSTGTRAIFTTQIRISEVRHSARQRPPSRRPSSASVYLHRLRLTWFGLASCPEQPSLARIRGSRLTSGDHSECWSMRAWSSPIRSEDRF